jgi:hypothetical protein
LYYALKSKRINFVDDQIYSKEQVEEGLIDLNDPLKEEGIFELHSKDIKTFEEFKKNSKSGYVGPFEIK